MSIPKKHTIYLQFKHNDNWYVVTALDYDRTVYHLYKVVGDDYEFLGTGNSPSKLEDRVYNGKY